jgi:hypothetical protein
VTDRIPLDQMTSEQLDDLYERLALLERGALERSALLDEARDTLANAGINEAHGGESWPRLVPAIAELVAERNAAYEEANEQALHNDATCEAVKERDEAQAAVERVRRLAQSWCGTTVPLGTSITRWWDARLIELNAALAAPSPPDDGQCTAESSVLPDGTWRCDRPQGHPGSHAGPSLNGQPRALWSEGFARYPAPPADQPKEPTT